MTDFVEFFLFSATSLFTMINPIGVIPIYIAMTEGIPSAFARGVAVKATLTAFLALVMFAFTDEAIFEFFSITTDSLRIVGGVLFFILGFAMLQARVRARSESRDNVIPVGLEEVPVLVCGQSRASRPGTSLEYLAISKPRRRILLVREVDDEPG